MSDPKCCDECICTSGCSLGFQLAAAKEQIEMLKNCGEIVPELMKKLGAAKAENQRLRDAFQNAIDTIHGEFCTSIQCHTVCINHQAALDGGKP